MVEQPGTRLSSLPSHVQRVQSEGRVKALMERPADDLPRKEVHDGRQVQLALGRRQVRDVGRPLLVGLIGLELPGQEIFRDWLVR